MKTIVLDNTKTLTAVLGSAVTSDQPEFMVAYADNNGTSFTEGSNEGELNGTTSVTLVSAPASGTRRVIKSFTIYNKDSADVTVSLIVDSRTVASITLNSGDSLTESGVYNNEGKFKSSFTATASEIGSAIDNATEKTTPVDGDKFSLFDTALKWISWSNIKSALSSTFATLSGGNTFSGVQNGIVFNSISGEYNNPLESLSLSAFGYEGFNTFGSLSGTKKWAGGVLAPNGKIYGIPRDSTSVLEIDPDTQSTSTFGSLSGTNKWYGGVLAPNGKIYGIPYNSTSVLEIDPDTQSTSTFGSLSGSTKWIGGVLAPNGKIYSIPHDSTSILEIDPDTQSTSTFGSLSGADKWLGGVLAPNGKIYGIPYNSTSVLEIDPDTQTTTTFGLLSGSVKWQGGVLAPNGKIYGIPRNSTSILEIDPDTQSTSTFGSLSGSFKWYGGVLAPNGKIYGIPRDSTSVLEIDPDTQTTTTFGLLSGSSKWAGGVLAPNGKIYGIPRDSTSILEIANGQFGGHWWAINAYVNKL